MPDRVVNLRHATPDDADALASSADVSRSALRPWATPPDGADAFRNWLRARQDGRHCVMIATAGHDIVGCLTLSEIVRGALQSAYLGYWGNARLSGRGWMTQAVRLMAAEAFGPLGLHRLEANIQPGNHRSIRLVRRAGFAFEGLSPRSLRISGVWRDHERWALVHEEQEGDTA